MLPIEYGSVSSLSMVGSLVLFQEADFVPHPNGVLIGLGILLIALGCGLIGARWTPVPALACACCEVGEGGARAPVSPAKASVAAPACQLALRADGAFRDGSGEGAAGASRSSSSASAAVGASLREVSFRERLSDPDGEAGVQVDVLDVKLQ